MCPWFDPWRHHQHNPVPIGRGFLFPLTRHTEYVISFVNVVCLTNPPQMQLIKTVFVALLSVLFLSLNGQTTSFFQDQLRYPRVKNAWKKCRSAIETLLSKEQIEQKNMQIFIRAFKNEGQLEVWGKNKTDSKFKKLKTWEICSKSGILGPKLEQGDGQVPEGIYTIDRFNPSSSYHLSLGISYPNATDLKRSKGRLPGGDIFIQGKCVTIGCLPMTDDVMEELYMYAVLARTAGQKSIPVHVFPFRMESDKMNRAHQTILGKKWSTLWKNLQTVYAHFEDNRDPGQWKCGTQGGYGAAGVK